MKVYEAIIGTHVVKPAIMAVTTFQIAYAAWLLGLKTNPVVASIAIFAGANVVELMRYYSPFRRYLDADYNNFE